MTWLTHVILSQVRRLMTNAVDDWFVLSRLLTDRRNILVSGIMMSAALNNKPANYFHTGTSRTFTENVSITFRIGFLGSKRQTVTSVSGMEPRK